MVPEAGAFELIFLAMVALIVVGPKDLPILLRKLGQFIAKMRGLAAEFRASFDELARQSELDELRKEVEALKNARIEPHITGDIEAELGDLNHAMNLNPNLTASSSFSDDLSAAAGTPKAKRSRAAKKPAAEPAAEPVAAKPRATAKPKASTTVKKATAKPARRTSERTA